jgi:hypothetical protein
VLDMHIPAALSFCGTLFLPQLHRDVSIENDADTAALICFIDL